MDFHSKKAIYLQIADFFIEKILTGKLLKEDRILSVRDLGIELGVNPNTVMRAYTYMQEEGLIYNKRGIGYFIVEDALEKAKNIKLNEFKKNELPETFRTMMVLDIKIEELIDLYNKHIKAIKNEK